MNPWPLIAHPGFGLRWRYPAITPLGHPVELVEEQRGEVTRLHLLSRGSDEVYFEVRRFPALEPEAAYAAHSADLAQRFAADGFSVTALAPALLAVQPAHGYRFRWQANERAVVLLAKEGALYRIIYDPRSSVNAEILATVTLG